MEPEGEANQSVAGDIPSIREDDGSALPSWSQCRGQRR
jgi:hypothetical protein